MTGSVRKFNVQQLCQSTRQQEHGKITSFSESDKQEWTLLEGFKYNDYSKILPTLSI